MNYGGPDDLWGSDLSIDDVEDSNFGFSLSIFTPSTLSPRIGAVDSIRMKVHYKVLE